MRSLHLRLVLSLGMAVVSSAHAQTARVVVRPEATAIEQFAAEELRNYLSAVHGIDTASSAQAAASPEFLLATADAVSAAVPSASGLSPQGILLKGDSERLHIVGGSPVAVLWGVYELVERWGVRYLVTEDVLPETPGPLFPPEPEIRLEPNMRTRCWRLVNDLADGPVSWSLEENQRFLRQIAKMKYNRVFLSFWPTQPFVRYTFQGMEKPAPCFSFGERFPIDEDTVGRERFGGMTEFTNPDYAGAESPEELVARATALARGILAEAARLGMETGIAIQPFDWPKEFIEVLPGSEPVHQLGGLTAGPGQSQTMDDPLLREMVATITRAYIETYPNADYLHVSMPEHRGWTEQAQAAYDTLASKYGLNELGAYDDLCARARARTSFPGGGERVETMLKGDLAMVAFFDSLVEEKNLLAGPDGGPPRRLVYNGVVEELFPLLAKMTPQGGEVLSFVDYTASRQLRQHDLLMQQPPESLPANLIFTLADDNVGVLPQCATPSLHTLMGILRANGWDGFYTRYWTVGDLMPTIHYLARASWNDTVTPEAAYRHLFEGVAGPDAAGPAMEAMALVEEVTRGLDEYGLGFGFPVPDMMTKHYASRGLADPIKADHERYRSALAAMQSARDASRPAGQRFMSYMTARLMFAVKYLDAAEAIGAAGRAEDAGDIGGAAAHADAAHTAIREALQAWADVAEDHGDLGAVALMNKYCYRPIRDKRVELAEKARAAAVVSDVPDFNKYPAGLWGYGGVNPNEVIQWSRQPATRSRIGHRGLYKTGLTQLRNGDVLACPCYNDKAAGKWRIAIYRSRDEGATWEKLDTSGDELLGKEPAIQVLSDGGVLVLTSHPHGFRVSRSDDGGTTWRTYPIGPVTEEVKFVPGFNAVRDVLVESDGALTLLMSKGTYYDLSAPPMQAWLYRSEDGGQTWVEHAAVRTWNAPESMFDEVSVVRLGDGRVLAAGRVSGDHPLPEAPPPRGTPTQSGDESGDHMVLSESLDGGLTWSEPRPLTGYGEPHGHLLPLRDGRILCCYSSYHLPHGVFAMLSEDGGRSWDRDHPVQLAFSMNCYTGWPTSTQLANGDILTAYAVTAYLEGDGVSLMAPGQNDTVAEAVRWQLPAPKSQAQR